MVTQFIPEKWLDFMDLLIVDGYIDNRSSFIRMCLFQGLNDITRMINGLEKKKLELKESDFTRENIKKIDILKVNK